MKWAQDSYSIAVAGNQTRAVRGHSYRGLGMHLVSEGSPEGRRPPRWSLSHLNSGHHVLRITAPEGQAFAIATLVAECGDWDFDGLQGWKNRDPDLGRKVRALAYAHPKECVLQGGTGDDDVARQIATARAS